MTITTPPDCTETLSLTRCKFSRRGRRAIDGPLRWRWLPPVACLLRRIGASQLSATGLKRCTAGSHIKSGLPLRRHLSGSQLVLARGRLGPHLAAQKTSLSTSKLAHKRRSSRRSMPTLARRMFRPDIQAGSLRSRIYCAARNSTKLLLCHNTGDRLRSL